MASAEGADEGRPTLTQHHTGAGAVECKLTLHWFTLNCNTSTAFHWTPKCGLSLTILAFTARRHGSRSLPALKFCNVCVSQSNKCLVRTARKGNRGIGLLDVTVHKNSMFNRFCPAGLVDIWPGRSKSSVQCTLNPTKFSFTCHMKDLKKGIKMDASS